MATIPAHWNDLPDRPLTVADLDRIPGEDGYRYELAGGRLEVSPLPTPAHCRAHGRLMAYLADAAPVDMEVLSTPGLILDADRAHYRIPDAIVMRADDFLAEEERRSPPVLAIEILTAESAFRDGRVKAAEYAEFGIGSYWLVDPEPKAPRVIEYRLDEAAGAYRKIAEVSGEAVFTTDMPFPVYMAPSSLVTDGPWRPRPRAGHG